MACNPEGAMDRRMNQFDKINILNSIADQVAALGQEKGLEGLRAEMDETCGIVPKGDFETVVDLSAPHPSLQGFMEIAEYRFAKAVAAVIAENSDNIEAIREICSENGQQHRIDADAEINDAFTWFEMYVLDGMPCDQTKGYFEEGGNQLKWEKLVDMHEEFWQKAGADLSVYYDLQQAYVNGLFSGSKISYQVENNETFFLKMA